MSLKNILCVAALAAVTASPALAQPTLSVDLVRNGSGIAQLDANGDWQWEVVVTSGADSSIAAELEATFTDADLLAGALSDAIFDTDNPSPTTLGWVTRDANGIVGFQASPADNEAVAAVGSDITTSATSYVLSTFTTDGPSTTGSLTSSISISGTLAQSGVNNAVSASDSATALAGDANLDGSVNFQDAGILSGAFNTSVANGWAGGDFTGDGNVNFQDAGVLSGNFNASGVAPAAGGSAPEPTAAALVALVAGAAGAYRRRR